MPASLTCTPTPSLLSHLFLERTPSHAKDLADIHVSVDTSVCDLNVGLPPGMGTKPRRRDFEVHLGPRAEPARRLTFSITIV